MTKTILIRCVSLAAVVVLAAGCTSLPAGSSPAAEPTAVATQAPAATVAPGSTEAAGSAGTPGTAPAVSESSATAEISATEAPTTEAAGQSTPPATTVPEPTMPPAPTAPPEAPATAAPAATNATEQIECTPGELTPSQTEGPYYKANPPEASDLLQPGMGGTKLTLTGYVLNAACQPVPGARVDFWQADSEGQYDNQGYTLRGWELTDAQGRYSVETVVPGLYPGRTRHIHVKVNAPDGPVLTTQLYFPDEAANQRDRIFSPELVLKVEKTADGEAGTFNFVINDK